MPANTDSTYGILIYQYLDVIKCSFSNLIFTCNYITDSRTNHICPWPAFLTGATENREAGFYLEDVFPQGDLP